MKTLRLLTLTLLVFSSPVGAMDMKVVGTQLILSGAVDGLDYQRFLRMLIPSVQMVVLSNSPGGDHQSGLDIAREIRSRGLSTVASGFCQSSCANIFLGGRERFLANNSSYLGFHGNYQTRRTVPSSGRIGQLKAFYSEMTEGKLSDEIVELFVGKQRGGYVAFFKHITRNCTGTEVHRPRDCEKLPQTAMEQGILTSVDDVKINAEALASEQRGAER